MPWRHRHVCKISTVALFVCQIIFLFPFPFSIHCNVNFPFSSSQCLVCSYQHCSYICLSNISLFPIFYLYQFSFLSIINKHTRKGIMSVKNQQCSFICLSNYMYFLFPFLMFTAMVKMPVFTCEI